MIEEGSGFSKSELDELLLSKRINPSYLNRLTTDLESIDLDLVGLHQGQLFSVSNCEEW
jgi:hypothetical protein